MNTNDTESSGSDNLVSATSVSTTATRVPLPPSLEFLISERHLLWYEDPEEYETILAEFISELRPAGAMEHIHVKEYVDCVWEERRLRRLKVAAIHASMPEAARRTVCNLANFNTTLHDEEHLKDLARASIAGTDSSDEETFAVLAKKRNVTSEVLHFTSFENTLTALDRISRDLERVQRRREQILKQVEDRRTALSAMARRLLEREQAGTALSQSSH